MQHPSALMAPTYSPKKTLRASLENDYFDNLSELQKSLLDVIENLDLTDITARAAREHEWSHERAEQATFSYRQFLFLVAVTANKPLSPLSADMDEVWHAHILFTKKYASDCNNVFGRFLHHSPHTSSTPADKIMSISQGTVLVAKTVFGESTYSRSIFEAESAGCCHDAPSEGEDGGESSSCWASSD